MTSSEIPRGRKNERPSRSRKVQDRMSEERAREASLSRNVVESRTVMDSRLRAREHWRTYHPDLCLTLLFIIQRSSEIPERDAEA